MNKIKEEQIDIQAYFLRYKKFAEVFIKFKSFDIFLQILCELSKYYIFVIYKHRYLLMNAL